MDFNSHHLDIPTSIQHFLFFLIRTDQRNIVVCPLSFDLGGWSNTTVSGYCCATVAQPQRTATKRLSASGSDYHLINVGPNAAAIN